jgi:hypothetical protein
MRYSWSIEHQKGINKLKAYLHCAVSILLMVTLLFFCIRSQVTEGFQMMRVECLQC